MVIWKNENNFLPSNSQNNSFHGINSILCTVLCRPSCIVYVLQGPNLQSTWDQSLLCSCQKFHALLFMTMVKAEFLGTG